MRNITKLLDKAENALATSGLMTCNQVNGNKVSAIAGFGAVVINLDVLPALAVYQNNHKDIVKALGSIVAPDETKDETDFFEFCKKQFASKDLTAQRNLKTKVIDASIALKIMARTYKINEKDEQ